jgi:hypothetical protein
VPIARKAFVAGPAVFPLYFQRAALAEVPAAGRRRALYYLGMMVTIALAFGWAFYLPTGLALPTFMAVLFFLGVFGGNFAIFSLWLPELFGTEARATAFAFCTSVGRFIGAGATPTASRMVASAVAISCRREPPNLLTPPLAD